MSRFAARLPASFERWIFSFREVDSGVVRLGRARRPVRRSIFDLMISASAATLLDGAVIESGLRRAPRQRNNRNRHDPLDNSRDIVEIAGSFGEFGQPLAVAE